MAVVTLLLIAFAPCPCDNRLSAVAPMAPPPALAVLSEEKRALILKLVGGNNADGQPDPEGDADAAMTAQALTARRAELEKRHASAPAPSSEAEAAQLHREYEAEQAALLAAEAAERSRQQARLSARLEARRQRAAAKAEQAAAGSELAARATAEAATLAEEATAAAVAADAARRAAVVAARREMEAKVAASAASDAGEAERVRSVFAAELAVVERGLESERARQSGRLAAQLESRRAAKAAAAKKGEVARAVEQQQEDPSSPAVDEDPREYGEYSFAPETLAILQALLSPSQMERLTVPQQVEAKRWWQRGGTAATSEALRKEFAEEQAAHAAAVKASYSSQDAHLQERLAARRAAKAKSHN